MILVGPSVFPSKRSQSGEVVLLGRVSSLQVRSFRIETDVGHADNEGGDVGSCTGFQENGTPEVQYKDLDLRCKRQPGHQYQRPVV
jgi:hypothetical protein